MLSLEMCQLMKDNVNHTTNTVHHRANNHNKMYGDTGTSIASTQYGRVRTNLYVVNTGTHTLRGTEHQNCAYREKIKSPTPSKKGTINWHRKNTKFTIYSRTYEVR
jgi:hypothetical protein